MIFGTRAFFGYTTAPDSRTQCLRDHERTADGLRAYEELRRERVERVVQSGASGENPPLPLPDRDGRTRDGS